MTYTQYMRHAIESHFRHMYGEALIHAAPYDTLKLIRAKTERALREHAALEFADARYVVCEIAEEITAG